MEMRTGVSCLAVLLCLAPAAAFAAEVEAEGRIAAVTVFPDRAEVTRIIEVRVPAGDHSVVLAGLPASLITESLRVRGDGEIRIGSVEARQVFAEQAVREDERRLAAEIEALHDQRRALADRIAALRVQLGFIEAIGKDAPKTANEELARGRLDPESWQKAWTLLGSGAAEAFDGIRNAELEQRALDRRVAQKQRQLNQIRTGRKASVTAKVNLSLDAAGPVRLALSYQLPGASWRPLYDARLDSESGKIELGQIGEVRQRTGEDWSAVALTLSTARPAASARMPDPGTWFIDFAQIRVEDYRKRKSSAKESFDLLDSGEDRAGYRGELEEEPQTMAQVAPPPPDPVAEAMAGEFASEYRIAGEVSVPADGASHKFVVARHDVESELGVRVVPKTAPLAYLFAEMTYPGEEPLLPGPVSVFRDGGFIGTGRLDLLRPGETQKLSFGIDDKVRVEHRLLEGERSRQGLIYKDRRQERRYLTEIVNHHARPIEITMIDRLPVPRDERIAVELLEDTTPPSETDVEDRKGVLAWTATYQPGEAREIRFGYAVTYPEDQAVPGF